jgi:hypothetical protein
VPRRSAADISTPRVVVNVKDHRPPAPDNLTEEQRAEWEAITRRLPGDFFPRECHPLLVAYVQHVSTLRLLSAEVDKFKVEWLSEGVGLTSYDKLLAMRERESRALSSLATRLRLSPQSRYHQRTAANAAAKPGFVRGRAPWECIA